MVSTKKFKAGEKAFILILSTGNEGKHIHSDSINDYIKEVTIMSVGTKNVYVDYRYNHKLAFSYKEYMLGFVQNTEGGIEYMLFPNKNDALEYVERKQLIQNIKKYFSGYYGNSYSEITLEKARAIMTIIKGDF